MTQASSTLPLSNGLDPDRGARARALDTSDYAMRAAFIVAGAALTGASLAVSAGGFAAAAGLICGGAYFTFRVLAAHSEIFDDLLSRVIDLSHVHHERSTPAAQQMRAYLAAQARKLGVDNYIRITTIYDKKDLPQAANIIDTFRARDAVNIGISAAMENTLTRDELNTIGLHELLHKARENGMLTRAAFKAMEYTALIGSTTEVFTSTHPDLVNLAGGIAFAGIALIQKMHARREELRVDEKTAEISGKPQTYASALTKFQNAHLKNGAATYRLIDPKTDRPWLLTRAFNFLASTHPLTCDRVRAVMRARPTAPQI